MPDPLLFQLSANMDSGVFLFSTSILRSGYRLSKAASFNGIQIIGRSSPIQTFGMSQAMQLDIEVELYAISNAQTEVTDVIKSFLALEFPIDPGIKPPPLCTITLGKELDGWKAVCANVEVHGGKDNIWSDQGCPMSASVGLSFIGIEVQNVAASEWLKARNFSQLSFRENKAQQ